MNINNTIIEGKLLDKIRRIQNMDLSKEELSKAFTIEEKLIINKTITQASELKDKEVKDN